MTPGILSRLFATAGQEPQWGPNPYPQQNYGVPQQQMAQARPQGLPRPQPLALEQVPSDLWGVGSQDMGSEDPYQGAYGFEGLAAEEYGPDPMPQIISDPSPPVTGINAAPLIWGQSNEPIDLMDPAQGGDLDANMRFNQELDAARARPSGMSFHPDVEMVSDQYPPGIGVQQGPAIWDFDQRWPGGDLSAQMQVDREIDDSRANPNDASYGGPQITTLPPEQGPLQQMFQASAATGGRMTSR